jgi:hypothetical protein
MDNSTPLKDDHQALVFSFKVGFAVIAGTSVKVPFRLESM